MSETVQKLAKIDAIREGKGYTFSVVDDEIAVFFVGGKYYAVSNVCPHQHVPLIAEGDLEGLVITCPMHGWRYNIATGKAVSAAGALKTYDTFVDDGYLFVRYVENDDTCW